MIDKFLIACEGELDKLLVKIIIHELLRYESIRKRQFKIDKSNGLAGVIKQITDFQGNCIGIIDNDKADNKKKKLPLNYSNFKECKELTNKNVYRSSKISLKYYETQVGIKYLIIIDPAPERWLDNCAVSLNKSHSDYGLPENFNEYKNLAKKQDIDIRLFRPFIKDILYSSTGGLSLKTIIRKIIEYHNFSA